MTPVTLNLTALQVSDIAGLLAQQAATLNVLHEQGKLTQDGYQYLDRVCDAYSKVMAAGASILLAKQQQPSRHSSRVDAMQQALQQAMDELANVRMNVSGSLAVDMSYELYAEDGEGRVAAIKLLYNYVKTVVPPGMSLATTAAVVDRARDLLNLSK